MKYVTSTPPLITIALLLDQWVSCEHNQRDGNIHRFNVLPPDCRVYCIQKQRKASESRVSGGIRHSGGGAENLGGLGNNLECPRGPSNNGHHNNPCASQRVPMLGIAVPDLLVTTNADLSSAS
jgi:hypothetical protein